MLFLIKLQANAKLQLMVLAKKVITLIQIQSSVRLAPLDFFIIQQLKNAKKSFALEDI